jgi:hypothetical protein
MWDGLRGIYTKHYEALSWLFVVEVAFVAAFFYETLAPIGLGRPFLLLLNIFVCPLVVAWPARNARLLRGAVINALFVLFLYAYLVYLRGWPVSQYILREFLTVLAFGMVSGMAAGGLVERRRGKWASLNPARPLPLIPAPISLLTDDYFSSEPAANYRS